MGARQRQGQAVVAAIDRFGQFVFVEPETGRTLRMQGQWGHNATFFWGWMTDRADGREVLIVEVKERSYQRGKPRMWVLDPRFDEDDVRLQETIVPLEIRTFPEMPRYLVFHADRHDELFLASAWQRENDIRHDVFIDNRKVIHRPVSRADAVRLPGPTLIGQGGDGQPAMVTVEQFFPGLEPGKPSIYRPGLSIVVRVGGEVVARSNPIEARMGLGGFDSPLTFVVGPGSDGRQVCALVVSDRLILYSIDAGLVRSLRAPGGR